MNRLILVGGPAEAGVSTHAAATAEALRDEGLTVHSVDASGTAVDPAAAALVSGSLGGVLGDLGADPLAPAAWSALPGLPVLTALLGVEQALEDADAVVVDAGGPARLRELLELPGVLVRLLDAALTPRLAMWRNGRGEATAFDALSAARLRALRLQALLQRPTTTVRLVVDAEPAAAERALRMLAVCSLLGAGVDGVVVTGYPRKSDGASRSERQRAAEVRDRLEAGSDGVAVWRSGRSPRAVPKGRSAMGPLGRVHVLDAEQLTVEVGDEDFALRLPIAAAARADARVGIVGDQLVVAIDDATRWLDLPPVLQRCLPTTAQRTPTGLRIRFTPDPDSWRQPGRAS